jgi:hypothetical protein
MGRMGDWVAQNWFNVLSAIGIIASLLFTADSLRSATKSQRIANLLTITENHREIWRVFSERPELSRVLNPSADLAKHPVTRQEEIFVISVLLHLSSVYHAMKDELLIKLEGLRRDVGILFSLPIPKAIWEKMKQLQNDDFVKFVEKCQGQNREYI